jgi:two-component system NtrC family sensor kinase
MADAAAAVPLRAHGVVVGALVVAEPRGGVFHANDIRLLSTIATHAAVVLANARFFEMVRHAKEQWETAFDALSEGMAVVDQEGRVRRANRSLAAMLGRPVIDVIGQDLSHALGQPPTLQDLLEATRRGERPSPLVARSTRLGRTMRFAAARMPNPTAEQSLVVLVEDVTDQQTMESQLIQSEKLAAVGQLVSGVAHELNNPLTSIAGLAEFLLEQHELGPNDRGHLRVIHEQAERAGRIVRNLLTFARKSTTERARVDLNDVVRRTLTLLSYDLRLEDVETRQELAPALPEILGDRPALQQVVLNLLTNAGHAVAGNAAGRARLIEVRTWFDGQVHLRVTDNGPGIPDEAVSQLFTPFFTTKEPGQGTGLGLSISYSIIQAHGGHIVLERPGEGGAAFRLDLPPAPPLPPAPAPSPAAEPLAQRAAAPPEVPVSPRRILLVDDDPAVRRVVRALFGREGHTVDVARNTQQALELAASNSYDLIIADGRATARGRGSSGGGRKLFVEELVARKAGLRDRILVATGDVQPATEEALGRLGLRYVRKPFNLRDLRDEAARVWAATTLS